MRGNLLAVAVLGMAGTQACGSDAAPEEMRNMGGPDDSGVGDGSASGQDAATDASNAVDLCMIGSAQNNATTGTLDVFGHIIFFAEGKELPAGSYRLVYEDGCMQFGAGQAWTVHAYPSPQEEYAWFIGSVEGERLIRAPGTNGHLTDDGGFADFEACVSANKALAPVTYEHKGGPLGIWLADTAYEDNVVGLQDRNPRWRLEHIDCD